MCVPISKLPDILVATKEDLLNSPLTGDSLSLFVTPPSLHSHPASPPSYLSLSLCLWPLLLRALPFLFLSIPLSPSLYISLSTISFSLSVSLSVLFLLSLSLARICMALIEGYPDMHAYVVVTYNFNLKYAHAYLHVVVQVYKSVVS